VDDLQRISEIMSSCGIGSGVVVEWSVAAGGLVVASVIDGGLLLW
jgi:hypothetical protein